MVGAQRVRSGVNLLKDFILLQNPRRAKLYQKKTFCIVYFTLEMLMEMGNNEVLFQKQRI